MKIRRIGPAKIIMQNSGSHHNYFGWPTVAKLQNGKIAVVASGFRRRHVCPFGKAVIAYSEDGGESYTPPAPVIDTVLDDRDGGILAFGESGVIVTSFNNTTAFQRGNDESDAYDLAYLDSVDPREEAAALSATFRISHDCGVTFGPIRKSPISSPHGPLALPDGTLLWVGYRFSPNDTPQPDACIEAHKIYPDGTMEYVGRIENVTIDGKQPLSCEPHAVLLDDGMILAHIRVEQDCPHIFTIYQSESRDGGKTWSKPVALLPLTGGAPPHILKHASGMLICTYGYRQPPYGIKAMFSRDNGKTWDSGHDIYVNNVSDDLGYPSSVELEDGSILTVFYAHPHECEPAVILQQKWTFTDAPTPENA
ncbi:MAG: exo-alpha-sialidase [Clostridia bacterium]|nr:exo-alpha-sialidase [Clostridia bacterium]